MGTHYGSPLELGISTWTKHLSTQGNNLYRSHAHRTFCWRLYEMTVNVYLSSWQLNYWLFPHTPLQCAPISPDWKQSFALSCQMLMASKNKIKKRTWLLGCLVKCSSFQICDNKFPPLLFVLSSDLPVWKCILKWSLHDLQQPKSAIWIQRLEAWVRVWLAFVILATLATWIPSCSVCATHLPWQSTSTIITTWKISTGVWSKFTL